MNEAQLLLQTHSIIDKKKRSQVEDLQKFLIIRDSIIEFLGVGIDVPPKEFEYFDAKLSKSHSFPLVYLAAPLLGGDSIQKMMRSYADAIKNADKEMNSEETDGDFEDVMSLISEGYETDEIVQGICGKNVDSLIEDKIKEHQDKEVANLSSTREELEDVRNRIMNENPVKKKKKPVQFNIKLED